MFLAIQTREIENENKHEKSEYKLQQKQQKIPPELPHGSCSPSLPVLQMRNFKAKNSSTHTHTLYTF